MRKVGEELKPGEVGESDIGKISGLGKRSAEIIQALTNTKKGRLLVIYPHSTVFITPVTEVNESRNGC
jgi:hypothetical protein